MKIMSNSRIIAPPAPVSAIEQRTMRRVIRRIVPFLTILFVINFLDRTNVGFAALRMNGDIGISSTIYGLGAGIFFLGYMSFEIPSNVLLHKFGARIWLARIMITWGLVATAMGFLRTPVQFVVLRVLLGVAEAGFFPGVIFLLCLWIPRYYRARTIATFYMGLPIAQVIGAPVSTGLMVFGNRMGHSGWRIMYVCEGVPAIILGIVCLFYLTDGPALARWLTDEERTWLANTLAAEDKEKSLTTDLQLRKGAQIRRILSNKLVWALALIYFGITSGSNTMNFFLPSVLQSFRGTFGVNIGLITNGFITAIPYAVAAAAMYYWSCRSDRLQERRKHTGGAAILAAISIAVALLVNNPIAIVLGFVLLAAGLYSAINVFWAIPQQMLSGVEAATGIALINSIGNLSGFAGPYITGFLYTVTGTYRAAFLVIAVVVALAGFGILMLPQRYLDDAVPSRVR
jgi:MFS transporter, ACS family, tartrate transporter